LGVLSTAAQEILWPKIDTEFQTEIDGIVKGANAHGVKADRLDIVALNALEELPYYYVPCLINNRDEWLRRTRRAIAARWSRREVLRRTIAS